jgi:hypothetical protein
MTTASDKKKAAIIAFVRVWDINSPRRTSRQGYRAPAIRLRHLTVYAGGDLGAQQMAYTKGVGHSE